MRYVIQRAALIALFLPLVACGGNGNGDESPGDAPQPTATEVAATTGGSVSATRTGQVTIGDETWTIDPNIQCGVFGGTVVAIAGHAVEDPDVEITLDYDPDSLVAAAVEKPDAFQWRSTNDDVSYEIDGNTIRGQGTFSDFETGETTDGSFEVTC